ncbi:MAG: alpha-(1-2)-phosphatidylinositol mannosyltransferase [Corynebacterium urealyticum]|uniref:Alpha-(1-2)-phosphatidylinositol mannosyltransferase n=1 Tax=Corynebacterium urealyticum TaxID=43771 RepID=A0A2W5CQ70_9CORY|nr:MAG: alpha-(1-2)-phosphatidylinositol mannosyltransferase [Corynebacterium urealyticum]
MPEQQNNGVPAPRVLVVTNDFPPTLGGIQTYIRDYLNALVTHAGIPAENIVVFASTQDADAAAEFDAAVDYHVARWPRKIMLPTPQVARRMRQLIREHRIETVWFGAAAPLAAMAPSARAAGATRVVASTHGHEVGWSMFPCTRAVLRYIGRNVDTLTFVSRYGVDAASFTPDEQVRQRLRHRVGVEDKKVIVAVSRVVPRKGQDTLVAAMPQILREVPDAHLVIVGPGDYAEKLQRRAEKLRVAQHVTFTGPVQPEDLAGYYSLGDVFALPVRTQAGGLSVEGLGIVFLEAQAAGRATVAGNGGGAPETIIDGVTGEIVDGRDTAAVATCLSDLLKNPERAADLAAAGQERVAEAWDWRVLAQQLEYVLRGDQQPRRRTPPRHSWNSPVNKK